MAAERHNYQYYTTFSYRDLTRHKRSIMCICCQLEIGAADWRPSIRWVVWFTYQTISNNVHQWRVSRCISLQPSGAHKIRTLSGTFWCFASWLKSVFLVTHSLIACSYAQIVENLGWPRRPSRPVLTCLYTLAVQYILDNVTTAKRIFALYMSTIMRIRAHRSVSVYPSGHI